jgi:hypothetical protein
MDLKTPYAENTKEARQFLESKGFKPLRFFMGKRFIYPIISQWANASNSWTEKDYSTVSSEELKEKTFFKKEVSAFEEFKKQVDELRP